MKNPKQIAGEKAATYVKSGMTVGLGTGSTAFFAIQKIGQMVKEGLQVKAIATSLQSERMANELGIPLATFAEIERIDLTIDGADEIDKHFQLIKGGGGALLREKIVADATNYYIIVADESKLVEQLGKSPLPVEIVQFGFQTTLRQIHQLGCAVKLRKENSSYFVTDNGNYIVDCLFGSISDPVAIHQKIKAITGVVESGLFINLVDFVIAASSDGSLRFLSSE